MFHFAILTERKHRVVGYLASIQKLADFVVNLSWLCDIIPKKRLPSATNRPSWIYYCCLKPFRALCSNVCREFPDHSESGISKNIIEKYQHCQTTLQECIRLFQNHKAI